jgi:hypothetical protein
MTTPETHVLYAPRLAVAMTIHLGRPRVRHVMDFDWLSSISGALHEEPFIVTYDLSCDPSNWPCPHQLEEWFEQLTDWIYHLFERYTSHKLPLAVTPLDAGEAASVLDECAAGLAFYLVTAVKHHYQQQLN